MAVKMALEEENIEKPKIPFSTIDNGERAGDSVANSEEKLEQKQEGVESIPSYYPSFLRGESAEKEEVFFSLSSLIVTYHIIYSLSAVLSCAAKKGRKKLVPLHSPLILASALAKWRKSCSKNSGAIRGTFMLREK